MTEAMTINPVKASGGFGTFERYLSVWVALCMVIGHWHWKTAARSYRQYSWRRIRQGESDQRSDCRAYLAHDYADDDEG